MTRLKFILSPPSACTKLLNLQFPFTIIQNLLHTTTIEPLPEYKTQSLKKSRFILSHYGVFKGFWDWLILVSTFYVAFVVPYNAAFVQGEGRLTMASDVVVEALFIVGEYNANSLWLFAKFTISSHNIQILSLTFEQRSCLLKAKLYQIQSLLP